MEKTFDEALRSVRRTFEAVDWDSPPSAEELASQAAPWIEAVLEAVRLAGTGQERDSLMVFADETATSVAAKAQLLWPLVQRVEKVFWNLPEHGDWPYACRSRSALEFVKDLYRGLTSVPGPFEVPGAGTEALDLYLEELAPEHGNLYANEVPAYIPRSHWWWWAPEEPPEEALQEPPFDPGTRPAT